MICFKNLLQTMYGCLSLGSYSGIPETWYKKIFTVPEAGKVQGQGTKRFGEGLFLGSEKAIFLLCPTRWKG